MRAHELAMSLRAAYLAMHRQHRHGCWQRTGVTADQFVVLSALSEARCARSRELVSRTSSDPNTMRAMLVLLERSAPDQTAAAPDRPVEREVCP